MPIFLKLNPFCLILSSSYFIVLSSPHTVPFSYILMLSFPSKVSLLNLLTPSVLSINPNLCHCLSFLLLSSPCVLIWSQYSLPSLTPCLWSPSPATLCSLSSLVPSGLGCRWSQLRGLDFSSSHLSDCPCPSFSAQLVSVFFLHSIPFNFHFPQYTKCFQYFSIFPP